MLKHDGDCTIFASILNNNPTDGICTCGYGLSLIRKLNGSQIFSDERRKINHSFYGGRKTIHNNNYLDVSTRKGKVVSVWFRCLALKFEQSEVDDNRAKEMELMYKSKDSIQGIDSIIIESEK